MFLRHFLYLDESLVRESISQADSGILEEQTITQSSGKDGKLGGDLKVGVASVKAEKAKNARDEIAQVLRQTPESQFNRLYSWLEGSGKLVEIFARDDAVWGGLRTAEVVAAQCDLELPMASRVMASPEEMEALGHLAPLLGQVMDTEARAAIEGLTALSQTSDPRMFAIGEVEDGAPKIVTTLKRASLRVSLDELEAEVTVVGILGKKIPAGERHLVFNLPGMSLMSRAERRQMAQSRDTDPSFFVEGPLGVVTPLAIF